MVIRLDGPAFCGTLTNLKTAWQRCFDRRKTCDVTCFCLDVAGAGDRSFPAPRTPLSGVCDGWLQRKQEERRKRYRNAPEKRALD
jgi:hypothetical protein